MGSRLPIEIASATPVAMAELWQELCDDPMFSDLPYKVETNERGQLLLSPAGVPHSRWQAKVTHKLGSAVEAAGLAGEVLTGCAIFTSQGVKVPDVAWISSEAWRGRADQPFLVIAPAICIEVMSPSNTMAEMAEQTALYLASGAREVWILDLNARMTFHDAHGARVASAIVPDFPAAPEQ